MLILVMVTATPQRFSKSFFHMLLLKKVVFISKNLTIKYSPQANTKLILIPVLQCVLSLFFLRISRT